MHHFAFAHVVRVGARVVRVRVCVQVCGVCVGVARIVRVGVGRSSGQFVLHRIKCDETRGC